MRPIGKIGVEVLRPGRLLVRGCSGGSGSPGRSAIRLTQCVGIAPSASRNFVRLGHGAILCAGSAAWLRVRRGSVDPGSSSSPGDVRVVSTAHIATQPVSSHR